MTKSKEITLKVIIALFLFNIFGCDTKVNSSVTIEDTKNHPTVTSNNLSIKSFKDGLLAYKFDAKLLERYEMVDTPYMVFRKGIHIETFKDSTEAIVTFLDADYAYYDEKKRVWEARGNVVGKDSLGKTLYTEQIFWNEKTRKIYSNVFTKIVNGPEVTTGSGFESDDEMKVIHLKQNRGRMILNKDPVVAPDSTKVDSTAIAK